MILGPASSARRLTVSAPLLGWFYLGALLGSVLLGVLGVWAMAARDRDARRYTTELAMVAARLDSLLRTPCQYIPETGRCVWSLTPRDTIRRRR
jgi:hypothetical protein